MNKILLVFLPFLAFASSIDSDLIIDKLDNGLTYYIKPNAYPKEKALLRLIVNVGSLQEREEERGLAHFVEHMVFRGSDNFGDWEAIRYLESIGAKFGAHTNAYTSFEETVYMLDIPLDKPETLEKALLILSDMAFRAHMKDELIEIERGVVLDEGRMRKDVNARFSEELIAEILENSSFASRLPIGLPEVVENCDPELLRDFYKRHYRPENMALIAVGDFDVEEVIALTQNCFSNNSSEEAEPSNVIYPEEVPEKTFLFSDPEMAMDQCYVCFGVKDGEPSREESTHLTLFCELLNKRFERAMKNPDSPFYYGTLTPLPLARDLDSYALVGMAYRGHSEETTHALLKELEKAKALGFTDAEMDMLRETYRGDLTHTLSNLDKIPHGQFVTAYQDHFLEGKKLRNTEERIRWKLDFIETVTSDAIVETAKAYFSPSHYFVASASSEPVIDFKGAKDLLSEKETWNFAPHIEAAAMDFALPHMERVPIQSQECDTALGVTTIKLKNGMTVLLKPTTLKKDEIDMRGFARGGYASLGEEAFNTAKVASKYLECAGLNGFSNDELKDFFSSRQILFQSAISQTKRELGAVGTKETISDLFRIIHARFKEKTVDERALDYLKRVYTEILTGYENNPEALFSMYAWERLRSNHPIAMRVIPDALSSEQMEAICVKAFENPADFTLAFSGDFTVEEILPEIETYLTTIPTSSFHWPTEIPFEYPFPKEGSQLDIFTKGRENKSQTYFQFLSPAQHEVEPYELAKLFAGVHLFERRLMKRFRQEEGETYYVNMSAHPCFDDLTKMLVTMQFPSDPSSYEKLIAIYEEERARLPYAPPTTEELEKAIEFYKNDKRVRLQKNEYWTSALTNNRYHGFDDSFIERFDHYEALSSEGVHELMMKLFDYEHSVQVTWLPEE